jgi:YbgC/YbaW family acyl-CoA thioester hydrolase
MARIKLDMPAQFAFSCQISVRITDINYGGHVGNDVFLSLMHEARVQYLQSLGMSELNLAGAGLIMTDVALEYKAELFYGDVVTVQVKAADFTAISFDLLYKAETLRHDKNILVAIAKTGMLCFDYEKRKPVSIPELALTKLKQ